MTFKPFYGCGASRESRHEGEDTVTWYVSVGKCWWIEIGEKMKSALSVAVGSLTEGRVSTSSTSCSTLARTATPAYLSLSPPSPTMSVALEEPPQPAHLLQDTSSVADVDSARAEAVDVPSKQQVTSDIVPPAEDAVVELSANHDNVEHEATSDAPSDLVKDVDGVPSVVVRSLFIVLVCSVNDNWFLAQSDQGCRAGWS